MTTSNDRNMDYGNKAAATVLHLHSTLYRHSFTLSRVIFASPISGVISSSYIPYLKMLIFQKTEKENVQPLTELQYCNVAQQSYTVTARLHFYCRVCT
ncbi:hypothetical protein J6590_006478 [Homalodisca vitripennis]|nr:hypothetical protein J6590_006478 [Homalodisca vitripennis]